ncbi:unnamed protein product, partial [Ectocarpus sp. 12 AP-2014]
GGTSARLECSTSSAELFLGRATEACGGHERETCSLLQRTHTRGALTDEDGEQTPQASRGGDFRRIGVIVALAAGASEIPLDKVRGNTRCALPACMHTSSAATASSLH